MHTVNKPIKINFTDFWARNNSFYKNWHVYKILQKHFSLEISEKPDLLFFSVHGQQHFSYNCHKLQYIDEPVHPQWWCTDFAISFDYIEDPHHLRLPNYVWWFTPEYSLERLLTKRTDAEWKEIAAAKKKFCCFMVSNPGGKERNDFFHQLSSYKKVDSAGRYLNNIGYELGHLLSDKFAFLQGYKFSMAFENTSMPGYTTEKLLNAKQADTVPIYWGNPLVQREMNPKSFLNFHDYGSFEKLLERVKEVDNNDELYFQYLKEPTFYSQQPNEYFDEERIVLFFENVIRSLGSTTPVAQRNLRYKAYKLKFAASHSKPWQDARRLYRRLRK